MFESGDTLGQVVVPNTHQELILINMRVIKLKQSQRTGILLDVRTLKEIPSNGVVTCQQFVSMFDKSIKCI